jgi:hypothetical protein
VHARTHTHTHTHTRARARSLAPAILPLLEPSAEDYFYNLPEFGRLIGIFVLHGLEDVSPGGPYLKYGTANSLSARGLEIAVVE